MKRQLIHGDSVKELKKFDDNSVDLLCTDPPYGYGFMGRDWDKVLPDIKIFEECFRVLKPGSMAFVMSAPRSDVQYRMAEMLERVGFRIDYTPIYWTYASGFPKAMNIGKMIDKRDGNDREVIGVDKNSAPDLRDVGKKSKEAIGIDKLSYGQVQNAERKVNEITKGGSELEGSYAGFQPKPAVEVVIVAMKPLDKKGYLEQAEDNQKGVTWFDDCRIPFEESDTPQGGFGAMDIGIGKPGETQEYRSKDYKNYVKKQKSFKGSETIGTTIKGNEHFLGGDIEQLDPSENFVDEKAGRFPANLLVSDDVLDDGKITNTNVKAGIRKAGNEFGQDSGWNDHTNVDSIRTGISDSGGYSRYFSLDNWFSKNIKQLPEPVQQTFPFMIVPKASKAEKNNGLDNFETKQLKGGGGTSNDTWYEDDVNSASGKFGSEKAPSRNIHPTVKPLTLMNYLVVLGSRKGDVVLEPFAGSGTTALACVGQERDYIAIEREEEYYEIAKARLEKVEQPLKLWEKFSG